MRIRRNLPAISKSCRMKSMASSTGVSGVLKWKREKKHNQQKETNKKEKCKTTKTFRKGNNWRNDYLCTHVETQHVTKSLLTAENDAQRFALTKAVSLIWSHNCLRRRWCYCCHHCHHHWLRLLPRSSASESPSQPLFCTSQQRFHSE